MEEKHAVTMKDTINCNAAKAAIEERVRSCESKLFPSRYIHNITAPGSITVQGNSIKVSQILMVSFLTVSLPDKCLFEIARVKRGDSNFYRVGKDEEADVYFDSNTIYTIHVTGLTERICSFYISKKNRIAE